MVLASWLSSVCYGEGRAMHRYEYKTIWGRYDRDDQDTKLNEWGKKGFRAILLTHEADTVVIIMEKPLPPD
jgi:hypothetical protein